MGPLRQPTLTGGRGGQWKLVCDPASAHSMFNLPRTFVCEGGGEVVRLFRIWKSACSNDTTSFEIFTVFTNAGIRRMSARRPYTIGIGIRE